MQIDIPHGHPGIPELIEFTPQTLPTYCEEDVGACWNAAEKLRSREMRNFHTE